jgi:membrane protease YdiL (CAAX protease family)
LGKSRFVTIVVTLVGAAVVAALWKFNRSADSYNQYLVGNLIGLLFVPMLTILLLFRSDPAKFGFEWSSSPVAWIFVGGAYGALVLGMLAVAGRQDFQNYYPIFKHFPEYSGFFATYPRTNPYVTVPMAMVFAEVSYGMYLFCWEFFFRGYLLFGLARSISWPAVFVQAVAFGLLHIGKPTIEVASSFAAGIILGVLALRAKSFLPCFVLHWAASVTFDLLVVFRAR